MKPAPRLANEAERLAALRQYAILDTPPDPACDELARLAAQLCATPIALIGFVDDHRLWLKSRVGFEAAEIPRDQSLCAYTILQDGPLVVEDLMADERFREDPLLAATPPLRFYAGVPLASRSGFRLGALCVLDRQPRPLAPPQAEALAILARQVMTHLELRRNLNKLARLVDQHRRTEEQLRDSEVFYENLVQALPQHILRKDRTGRFTFANRKFCDLLNKPLEAVLGRTDYDFFPPELASKYQRDDLRVMSTEQALDTIEPHVTPAGDTRYVHVLKTPLYDAQGQVVGIQGIFWDVTDRKRVEEELAYERDLLRALLQTTPDRIFFKDADSRFLRCSASMVKRLGLTDPKQLEGKTDFDIFPREWAQEYYADEQQVILTQQPLINKVFRRTTADGQEVWSSVTKVTIFNQAGAVTGLVGISRDVEYDIRNHLFRRLTGLSWDFYARYRTGDIMARATNDLSAVRMMLGPAVMYLAETSLTFALALAIMLSADWRLTLWALLPAPLVSVVVVFFGRRIHERFEKIQGIFSEISSRVQENLSGARVIRAYVREEAEIERFARQNEEFVRQNLRLARYSGLFMPLLEALIGLTFLLVLWVGGKRVLAGEITLGGFVMFNTYMGMLVWPMIAFGWVVNLVERGSASMKRIMEFLAQRPAIAAPAAGEVEIGGPGLTLRFEDVSLEFDGRRVLDRISMEIPAGSTVAIVGRTGSGKTLLASLAARLFDPTSGAVLLNGVDLRQADPEKIRRRMGFVPQETFLFSATLAENIALGVENAQRQEIEQAAAMAGLAADIESFPKGLDTEVGERGVTLSGGQKQRVAIARALLRNPELLVLDDALSAVDTLTEETILSQLRRFRQGRTTILISHRVSTVRDAGRIYVLDHGRLVEQGTHAELLARSGYYAELHQKQMLEEEIESI